MEEKNLPISTGMVVRAVLQSISGAIPFAGGLLSAAISLNGEIEQEKTNILLQALQEEMEDEIKGLVDTISEINHRLSLCEKNINKRVSTKEYRSLFIKAMKNWSQVDCETRRVQIRNILTNAALSKSSDDDKVKQYIDWTMNLSMMEIKVLSIIREAQENGISRKRIWVSLGNEEEPREVSKNADYFRLALRKLQGEQLIRVKKKLEDNGNLLPKDYEQGDIESNKTFDDEVPFRLTNLGKEYADYISDETIIEM